MQIKIHAVPLQSEDGHKFIRVMSPVDIINPIAPDNIQIRRVMALWDTGATNTSIPMETATALGLRLGDECGIRTAAANKSARWCKFFLGFPDGTVVGIAEGTAMAGMTTQLIIGMDVMSKGVTTIEPDGSGGVNFTFTL